MEDFADVVHLVLDAPDPPKGIQCIFLHWFGTQGLIALWTQSCPQEVGPGGFLVFRTRSRLQKLGPDDNMAHRTQGGLQGLGPELGFGS
jgi:hypothetical protein